MFSAASVQEMAKFYGGFSDRHMSGIWSVLLTQNATESRIFGEKYFSNFNKIAQQDWHLGICANMHWEGRAPCWNNSDKMQKVSDGVRQDLIEYGTVVPECCIVFFDPVLSGLHEKGFTELGLPEKNYQARAVIIDLDWSRIGDVDIYMKYFAKTHQAIIKSMHSNGIRQGDIIEDDKYEDILQSLADEMRKIGLRSSIRPWIERGKDSFFAAAVAALFLG